MPDGLMDLDEGEEVSPAEIAGIMSELGVAKKPKAQAASCHARPQAATAAVVPGGSAMGPASGPTTGFDLARSRLAGGRPFINAGTSSILPLWPSGPPRVVFEH